MKTKLTLTVHKHVIQKAKHKAREKGVSLSQLFEDVFNGDDLAVPESEDTLAARRLADRLRNSTPIPSLEKTDKELIKDRILNKYG